MLVIPHKGAKVGLYGANDIYPMSQDSLTLSSWPLMDALRSRKSILLAGMGGGFDIYSALPLYFSLRERGQSVHLASLSFASLPLDLGGARRITPHCLEVRADLPASSVYFPEFRLTSWFRERLGEEAPVFAFAQTGVAPLRQAYEALAERLQLDAVVLVDGGTDSLMRGDEFGLGTPEEDISSLAAVASCSIPHQYLACIGFGIDTYHGVCHAHFLESVAALTREGAFLGVSAVLPQMECARRFLEAVEHANLHTPGRESIVANSIASAVQGHFGNHHAMERTCANALWINPLMPIYWAFDLPSVARRCLYLDLLSETVTRSDVEKVILQFRAHQKSRLWEDIPF